MATSTAQVIATVPVWDYLYPPGDPTNTNPKALAGKRVKVTLSYAQSQSANPVTLLGADPVVVQTDANGFWQVNLVPNNKISPSGTIYIVEIEGYRSYVIQVTDVNAPAIGWQSSAIATLPPVGGGAPGYTLPGGTEVLGNLKVDGTFETVLTSLFDQKAAFAQGPIIDITHPNYGAKGDARWVTDAAITINTPNMTSATAVFTLADVGKIAIISGAGASGLSLITTILSVQSGTACTLALSATATVSGKNACIGTGNFAAVSKAITQQQTGGGRLRVPKDSFGGKYLIETPLIAAPGYPGPYTNSTVPLVIEGEGQQTGFVAASLFAFDGLFGYTSLPPNLVFGRIELSDIMLDGNYSGVAGGALDQPASAAGALLSIGWPFTTLNTDSPNGQYHSALRVRFYRPTGYVTQGCHGWQFTNCEFDSTGQPPSALHYDNIGSGLGDVMLINCNWHDGSGNYVDMVSGTPGQLIRTIMIGCTSTNHALGGVFGCGRGSIIMGNRLSNNSPGSGIGYDAATVAANRANNIVANNVLTNLTVNSGGLSASLYGDLVYGNVSSDTPAGAAGFLQGGLYGGFLTQSIAFAASVTPDLSKGQNIILGTLTAGITINNPTNVLGAGQIVTIQFTQDATGGRTVTWGGNFKGQNQPVLTANSVSYMAFITDAAGLLWPLTAFPMDASATPVVQSGYQVFRNGIVLGVGRPIPAGPNMNSPTGTELQLEANGGVLSLRPAGNSNNNMFSTGAGAGTWTTYDGAGVARNTLDDGSGNMQLAGVLKNKAATATMGATLKKGSGGGNYVSASTTYVDVDATNLALTVTIPTGWKLVINASGQLTSATAVATVSVSLLDGSTLVEAQVNPTVAGTAGAEDWALNWVITGDGASHTVKLQYKTSNGADSATILNSSGTLLPTMVFTLMPSN